MWNLFGVFLDRLPMTMFSVLNDTTCRRIIAGDELPLLYSRSCVSIFTIDHILRVIHDGRAALPYGLRLLEQRHLPTYHVVSAWRSSGFCRVSTPES